MIIPVRCFTCGHVIADKWRWYERKLKEGGSEEVEHADTTGKGMVTLKAELLNQLGMERMCCRRMFIGNVDVMDII
jgi:DNA-directed RNA polymerase subunit N (RpoN/RPB10)